MAEMIKPSDARAWAEGNDPCREPHIFQEKAEEEIVFVEKPIEAYSAKGTLFDIRSTISISPIRYRVEARMNVGVIFDDPKKVGSCRMLVIHPDGRSSPRYAFLCA